MKSHELAKKLLSMPELDIFTEVTYQGNPNWEYKTVKFEGDTTITPEGIFLEPARFFVKQDDFRSPNDEPVVGSFLIFFNDGLVVRERFGDSRLSQATVKYISDGKSTTHEYGSYNMEVHNNHNVYHRAHEVNIVLVTNKETYEAKPLYASDDTNYEHRYIDDIDFVKVLVSYDPETWTPQYDKMTYEDAVEFGKKLKSE